MRLAIKSIIAIVFLSLILLVVHDCTTTANIYLKHIKKEESKIATLYGMSFYENEDGSVTVETDYVYE